MPQISEETSRDEIWIKGSTFDANPDGSKGRWLSDWLKLTDEAYDKAFWFVGQPEVIAKRLGVETTPQRAKEFDDLMDGNLDGWYYIYDCSESTRPRDDSLKWVMNSIGTEMKNSGEDGEAAVKNRTKFKQIAEVFPAWMSSEVLGLIKDHVFDLKKAKDILKRVIEGENYYDVVRDLKYFNDDDPESFVDIVFARSADQVEKAKADPKLVNWLVGQVMKEAKGKASAADVQEIVKRRLS